MPFLRKIILSLENPLPKIFPSLFYYLITGLSFIFLIASVFQRTHHTYLEDDMLWFVPLHLAIAKHHSWVEIWGIFHGYEMTLVDGVYFYFLNFIFGPHLKYFVLTSLFLHLLNSLLLFRVLVQRLRLSYDASFAAALIFMTFYGQLHVYVWPLAAHHLLAIFLILIILDLYFRVEERAGQGKAYQRLYGWALGVSLLASFSRLSILIVPFMILVHIFFCSKDRKEILKKYSRWLPLFIIFCLYPVGAMIAGKQAVLKSALEPLYELLEGKQDLLTAICGSAVCVGVLFLFRLGLQFVPVRKGSQRAAGLLSWLPIVFFLVSVRFLFLSLHLFLNPLESALSEDILLRWHPIYFPAINGVTAAEIVLLTILLGFFIFTTMRHNRNLIIFVAWYIFLIPYLGSRQELIYSRYFIFISPVLAVVFTLFFMEFLPRQLPQRWVKAWMICFYVLVFFLIAGNLFAVKLRLFRTTLVDYHWSYDYIKIAHLIKRDVQTKNLKDSEMICVSGVQEIPYATGWRRGFLSFYPFDYSSPFRQTLSYLTAWPASRILTRAECPASLTTYSVNAVTVLDANKKNIEPFYQYFYQGLEFLKRGDERQARAALQEAQRLKPFLLQFLEDPLLKSIFGKKFFSAFLSDTAEQIILRSYDGDPKINYINNMIQTEAEDYAVGLALSAYLESSSGNKAKSRALLEEAFLFVSADEIVAALPSKSRLSNLLGDQFVSFLKTSSAGIGSRRRLSPGSEIETYRGFVIHWFRNSYFAWPREEGGFHLGKLRRKQYSHIFTADTKHKIKKAIDAVVPLKRFAASLNRPLKQEEIEYKSFKIIPEGEEYVIAPLAEEDLNRAFVRVRSLREAKLLIDAWESL
ncbi:MAG: hypothetical protein A3D10_01730 [Omnitrophica WOR_2 bacterium RIFCSPHIGHO2_02_FULL_48_11]|nr:MAG: hypothetical protein A3D10_01730 [Omnitrophica WOR_2 bacterium RIFCSPHIGHO2_02_FULL_48_11]